jgi:secreted trypsin-like serine protease
MWFHLAEGFHTIYTTQKGDSGGGLIQGVTNNTNEATLVEIVAQTTEPCAGPDFLPTVFTNVGAICAWVEHEIQHF